MKVINIQDIDTPEDCATYDELVQFADKIAELAVNYLEVAEPKRGRWIRKSEETPYLQGVYKTRCSECGGEPLYISTDEWEDTYRERLTPYCPYCGARMEE